MSEPLEAKCYLQRALMLPTPTSAAANNFPQMHLRPTSTLSADI
jgi:hypothetical protein